MKKLAINSWSTTEGHVKDAEKCRGVEGIRTAKTYTYVRNFLYTKCNFCDRRYRVYIFTARKSQLYI